MEKILNIPLLNLLMESELFYKEQYGFLPGRSATLNLLQSMDDYTKALESARPIDAIFLDFSRAFDKVHHEALGQQLLLMSIPPIYIRFISAFISARTQYVSMDGVNSLCFPVRSGVIQGTILSATLFAIFINSLAVHTYSSKMLMFADDVKLLSMVNSDSLISLQDALNGVSSWSESNHLPLSMSKSVVMHLGKHNNKNTYSIMGNSLECVDYVKDLGITYDQSLCFSMHISDIVTKAHRRSYMIRHCLGKCDNMSKVRAFNVYVRPILEYGSSVWCPDLVRDIKMVENVQKRFTKYLPGMGNIPYQSRLVALGMISLERRRLINDLCLIYKMVHKLIFLPDELPMVDIMPPSNTRRHDLQIRSATVKCKKRFHFFTLRTARVWNNLPSDIVHASSMKIFKLLIYATDLAEYLKVFKF